MFDCISEIPAADILEMFGMMFFDYCEESGYDKILKVLGSTTRDFLQNLDALHDHLATIYPGMRAPSFRCSVREEDGATILHYYSERPGLEHIVIGIVKAVAKKLHNSEVNVEKILGQEDGIDHIQFAIIEKTPPSEKAKNAEIEKYEKHVLSQEPKISPASFCRAFPFHLMFSPDLTIIQAGSSIVRVMPETGMKNYKITELFDMVRPHMEFNFQSILSHINTIYVLRTMHDCVTTEHEDSRMRLKGEMVHIAESNAILFLCSPSVMNLDDLNRRSLYLSDIPLHDATRDLVLLSEHWEVEYKLTQKLEFLTDKLQQKYRELEEEKKKTDGLVK